MQPKLVAGDTLDFLTTVPGYPPTDGWTLNFRLTPRVGAGSAITFSASTSGSAYRAQVSPGTTAAWPAGDYTWASWVSKTGARYSVDSGQCTIRPDPSTLASGTDTRGHVQKVLDAVEAVIANRATYDQMEYSINGRSLRRMDIGDLLKLRQLYLGELRAADAAARLSAGLGGAPRLQVRF